MRSGSLCGAAAEAGFFPACCSLTYWFPQAYLGRRWRLHVGIPLAFIIGAPVSSMILQLDGVWGLQGWQWLFLIEGLPAALFAFAVPFMLPDGPHDAPWLTTDEKKMITARLVREDRGEKGSFWAAFLDACDRPRSHTRLHPMRSLRHAIVAAADRTITRLLQFDERLCHGDTLHLRRFRHVPLGHKSDAAKERIWHIVMPCLFAAAGLVMASLTGNYLVVLIGLACALVGLLAVDGPLFALPRTFLSGAAAASGIALLNFFGSLGRARARPSLDFSSSVPAPIRKAWWRLPYRWCSRPSSCSSSGA